MTNRISTGVTGIDEILHGGFIAGHSYLLVGQAGTGKTILSLQWLLSRQAHGDRCLYITLAEDGEKIIWNMKNFGWQHSDIDIVDLAANSIEQATVEDEYHIFSPSEVEQFPMWQSIYQTIAEKQPQVVVIDSLTQLRYLSIDEYQFRKHLQALVKYLGKHQCTALLLFEPTELAKETSVALAVDGVLRMQIDISPNRVIALRSLQVEKFRGSDFMSGLHALRITKNGIIVYPHRIEEKSHVKPARYQLRSNISQLDHLFGGGIESGTITMLTGPTGVGKTTLGMHMLIQAAKQDMKGVIYEFEEAVGVLTTRCRNVGLPIDQLLKSGQLKIVSVNPLELYPDEFLSTVRADVEKEKFNVVMIDSLRGYNLAMEEFGSLIANMHNLVTYLNSQQVITFMINELGHISGELSTVELGVSYLTDNLILLRYAEYQYQIVKVINCLKKRLSTFEPELRQIQITTNGIKVSEKLEQMKGVLSGVPGSF